MTEFDVVTEQLVPFSFFEASVYRMLSNCSELINSKKACLNIWLEVSCFLNLHRDVLMEGNDLAQGSMGEMGLADVLVRLMSPSKGFNILGIE